MKNNWSRSILLACSLFLSAQARAAILLVTSQNLEDFSFSTKHRADRTDCWNIRILVSGKTYTHYSCDNTASDLWEDLKKVMRSPQKETCVVREWCDHSGCTREYGERNVETTIKALHDDGMRIQRFFELTTPSRCM